MPRAWSMRKSPARRLPVRCRSISSAWPPRCCWAPGAPPMRWRISTARSPASTSRGSAFMCRKSTACAANVCWRLGAATRMRRDRLSRQRATARAGKARSSSRAVPKHPSPRLRIFGLVARYVQARENSVHRRGRSRGLGIFHMRDRVLDRLLHLLEGAHLDLADALARHAELIGELFQGDRIVGETPRLEDATLAIVEHRERFAQRLVPIVRLLGFGEPALLADAVVDQPIHPLAGIAVLADRRVERRIAAEPAVHVDDVLLGDAQP